ncbi:MAG: flagellar protein FlaI [Candidatus Methanomethylicota archaeon]|uniref:Flagellar protein FlaI n=1 Tax=Thermoproteota archaeon TaxID=2056631 RepID=A0A497EX88_9CREN|nr:MAG: flagellar protein FlaI [Candidatus Verstraetearchaeota archaeon]
MSSSDKFQLAMRRNPHLKAYIDTLLKSGFSTPTFYDQLSDDLKKQKIVNVIYPIGDPLFVHVYTPTKGTGYKKYVVVEPIKPSNEALAAVEKVFAKVISDYEIPQSPEEKAALVEKVLDKIIEPSTQPINYSKLKIKPSTKKVPVYTPEIPAVKYYMIRDKVQTGILEPFLRDPYLEDITCAGVGSMYVVHKVFGPVETNIKFESEEELDSFVLKLSEMIGKPVSHARPVVDASLPDGSRINIVFGKDVSKRGSNFTIRKFSKVPVSITQLIKWGTLDARIAAYLWILLNEGVSLFVCGETASGKTTTLNAICAFIKPTAKIVSIEDTPEVTMPHENWVPEITRETGSEGSSVTMFDLLKAALRQRPNYIIVGEIRGREGNIAFQAMQTGHPVLSTFHAASVERLIQRITSYPIEVPKTHIDNLNVVLIQSAVYDASGMLKRRVLSVNEIMGYDLVANTTIYLPIFTWDSVTDKFLFRGMGSSYLLEEKVAVRRGIPKRELKRIYDELDKRARFLELLVKNKVFNYYDVWNHIVETYFSGLDEVMAKLERGVLVAAKQA